MKNFVLIVVVTQVIHVQTLRNRQQLALNCAVQIHRYSLLCFSRRNPLLCKLLPTFVLLLTDNNRQTKLPIIEHLKRAWNSAQALEIRV